MTNKSRPAPRLSTQTIADAERILNAGNRVELMPTENNGVRMFEIIRNETRKTPIDKNGASVI